MSGSVFGRIFSVSTWGESHGPAVGVTVDGCPAGVPLEENHIQYMLDRRRPTGDVFSTPRRETDRAEILSGVFRGLTTGTPISILVRNKNQRPEEYDELAHVYRPGHGDLTYDMKYGFRDHRGGGRASGRFSPLYRTKSSPGSLTAAASACSTGSGPSAPATFASW